ncbi:MAG: SMP-30/gluconolactonase/LRE family protein [Nitrososphaerales archaeon]
MKRILWIVIAVLIVAALAGTVFVEMSQSQDTTPAKAFAQASKPQVGTYITEYSTQAANTNPNGIAVDSNGNVWFVLGNVSTLSELTPSNGTLHEYSIPGSGTYTSLCWGMVYQASKNMIWFTDVSTNTVYSFSVSANTFTRYSLHQSESTPFGIAIDSQGNVWFTESGANKLGEVTYSGQLKEITIPTTSGSPAGVSADKSGTVWVALPSLNEIASYGGGRFQFYNLTELVSLPAGIFADGKGNIWIMGHGTSLFAEFNPVTHYFKSISTTIPPLNSSLPYFDYMDSNGNLWFNEHYGNAIAEYNPSTSALVEYEVPTKIASVGNISGALTMNLSPRGAPWFTEIFSGKVGTVNVSAPVPLSISATNSSLSPSNPIPISNGNSVSISLSIGNSLSEPVSLRVSVGNITGSNFQFSFSPSSQISDFDSTLTITNVGSAPGVYFVTVGAQTANVIVSTILEIQVSH